MPTTRFVLTPQAAEFPTANFAPLWTTNQRPVLAYDAGVQETAYWTFVAPQGMVLPLTAVVSYAMASATSGNVVFEAALEAVSDGDVLNLNGSTSFATVNTSAVTAVPAGSGNIDQISISLTNNDSIAVGDYVRLSLARAAANASDTASGDCYVLAVELRDDA